MPDASAQLFGLLLGMGFRPEREVMIVPGRRWRFDLAFPLQRVAVEVHGATYRGGRHVTGAGFGKDRQKMNAAQLHGWIVLEYTTEDLRKRLGEVIEEITSAISGDGMPLRPGTKKTRTT